MIDNETESHKLPNDNTRTLLCRLKSCYNRERFLHWDLLYFSQTQYPYGGNNFLRKIAICTYRTIFDQISIQKEA